MTRMNQKLTVKIFALNKTFNLSNHTFAAHYCDIIFQLPSVPRDQSWHCVAWYLGAWCPGCDSTPTPANNFYT